MPVRHVNEAVSMGGRSRMETNLGIVIIKLFEARNPPERKRSKEKS